MNAHRKKDIAEMTAELATIDLKSTRARDLRCTIQMNEQYMEAPYTDAFSENSQGNVEMGASE